MEVARRSGQRTSGFVLLLVGLLLCSGGLLAATTASPAPRGTLLDLLAVDLTAPSNATIGETVPIIARVANVGQERANNTTLDLGFRASGSADPLTTIATYDFLVAGTSINVSDPAFQWDVDWDTSLFSGLTGGPYDLVFTSTDPLDVNLTNNSLSTQIELYDAPPPPTPRLSLLGPLVLPSTWFIDDGPLELQVRLSNVGTGAVTPTDVRTLQLRTVGATPQLVAQEAITDLKVGKSQTIELLIDGAAQPTNTSVSFQLTVENGTDPVNETLPAGPVEFHWRAPDLGMKLLLVLPSQPVATELVTVRVQVLNNGTLDALGLPLALLVDGIEVAGATINVSDNGGSMTTDLLWQTDGDDSGARLLTISAPGVPQPLQFVLLIGPQPVPNLYLTALAIPALARLEEVGATQQVSISAVVFNNGTAPISDAQVALLVDGAEVDHQGNLSVGLGSSTSVTFRTTFTTPENDQRVAVEARVLTAADPLRGSLPKEVLVPGDDDAAVIALGDLTIDQATQEQARPVFLNLTVRNSGDAAEQVSVVLATTIEGQKGVATVSSTGLSVAAGATVVTPLRWDISATEGLGVHTVTATVGGLSRSGTVEVTPLRVPVLWVRFSDESFYKTAPTGKEIEFKVELKVFNAGEAHSGRVSVTVYTELGDQLCLLTITDIAPDSEAKVSCSITQVSETSHTAMHYSATVETVSKFAGETVIGTTERSFAALIEPAPTTPGFELVGALVAIALTLYLSRRTRSRDAP